MRLAWHIAWKDIRRFALPVAIWLALIAVPTLAFRMATPIAEGDAEAAMTGALTLMSIWARVVDAIQTVIAFALVAAIVLLAVIFDRTSQAFGNRRRPDDRASTWSWPHTSLKRVLMSSGM